MNKLIKLISYILTVLFVGTVTNGSGSFINVELNFR